MLVVQHPVTTSFGNGRAEVNETLMAVSEFRDIQKIVLWPNVDAGSDDVSRGIRHFREFHMDEPIFYVKNFSPEDYARVLNNAVCCVGNSSSFIREAAFLGVPVVLVGDRQQGREHGANVIFSDYDRNHIYEQLRTQILHGRYETDRLFGEGCAGQRIAAELATIVYSHGA